MVTGRKGWGSLVVAGFFAWLLTSVPLVACVVVGLPADHFLCYGATTSGFTPRRLLPLDDQFDASTVTVDKLVGFCAPVAKDEGVVQSEVRHLTCYNLKDVPKSPTRRVHVDNQFGPLDLDVFNPSQLCLPASKSLTESPPEQTPGEDFFSNHFQCYQAKLAPGQVFAPRTVTLDDQFDVVTGGIVEKPVSVCNPVMKNFEPYSVVDPTSHLVCYAVNKALHRKRTVTALDQFGMPRVDVAEVQTLCVPSTKTVPD